ncbi:hypothetical protein ACS0TY_003527 [Phlomoides rotata]
MGYIAACLDRVLVNDDFLDLWQSTSATVLPRISSDHHLILLRLLVTADHVIRPFRFKHMWSTHSSFLPLVTASWSLSITANNHIHRVTQKLKRLKVTLKAWNRATFRNFYVVMKEAVEALNAVQAEAAAMGDTDEDLWQR